MMVKGARRALIPLASAMEKARDITFVSHVSPDGDTLGSALTLMLAMRGLGKTARVVCQDEVPPLSEDLPCADEVLPPDEAPHSLELVVAVDSSDPSRVGSAYCLFERAEITACLDHHMMEAPYVDIPVVVQSAPAVGVLTMELLDMFEIELTQEMALCLYTAISTDTGNFSNANTDAQALYAAARCVEFKLPVAELTMRLFRERTPCATALLGRALSGMRFYEGGKVAVIALSQEDMVSCQASPSDDEGFVNYGIETQGVLACAYLREREEGIKCSLRSIAPINVGAAAQSLGGGGHMLASGAVLDAPNLQTAEERVVEALRKALADARA